MKESIVARRFAAFIGRTVDVRVTWNPNATFAGEIVGVAPVGRAYFLEVRVDGRTRMLATSAVLELAEAPCE